MSNNSNLLDLPNDGLLFDSNQSSMPSPNATPSPGGAPSDSAQSQEHSDKFRKTPSAHGVLQSHRYDESSLLLPWSSNQMNQWPHRLFTIAPPTPLGGSSLPIASFRLPSGQQELDDLQSTSQLPPPDPALAFTSRLSPTNSNIYKNCKGNRQNLWPQIAEEIYNLQVAYGELILPVPGPESDPRYICGICNHPSTVQKVHLTAKRRWDWSPDILAHGLHHFKPWFCECGRAFPRDRERRRHAEKCPKGTSAPYQPSILPLQTSTVLPLRIPPFPLENTTRQEPVMPSSPMSAYPARQVSFQSSSAENMTPLPTYWQTQQGPLRQWTPQQPSHSQENRRTRSSHSPDRVFKTRGSHASHPHPYAGTPQSTATNHGGNPYFQATASSALPLQLNGASVVPQHADPTSSGMATPYPPPYGSRSEKDFKVRFCAPLADFPSEKTSLLEGPSRRESLIKAHPFAATVCIFLSLIAIFWFGLFFFVFQQSLTAM